MEAASESNEVLMTIPFAATAQAIDTLRRFS
jgi:hypothetical protein